MTTPRQRRYQKRRGRLGNTKRRKAIREYLYKTDLAKYGIVCCKLCGMPIELEESTIDHKVPIAKGGSHKNENLQLAHQRCNRDKGDKL